jgi:hypothetical protein
MFHRFFYAIILVAVLWAAWFKGSAYVYEVNLGQVKTVVGFLDLGYLLTLVIVAIMAVRMLLRGKPSSSHRVAKSQEDLVLASEPARDLSVLRIRTAVRRAFSTKPLSASLLLLFLASIPVCLAALSVGGLGTLSRENWGLIGIAELPLAIVVMIALSKGTPSR